MSDYDHVEKMTVTEADLRLMKRSRFVARFVLLPLAVIIIGLKLTGRIERSWLLVLVPLTLYAAHPLIIGALGPLLQYRRSRSEDETPRG